ncbi:MAG: SAM-dependent methyltransferase [Thermoprotei archaeon]|nr:MAG: SAM-dependent methyltransferase [Thermoprotei archaeon]RLF18215.1 MAG: SAM-dependent methyltransferase [Thermoprotei archaeon]
MKLYEFRSLNMPILTSEAAKSLLKAKEEGGRSLSLTFNLGLSKALVELLDDGVVIEDHTVSYEELKWALKDEDAIYILEPPGRLRKAVLYTEGKLYKLKKVAEDKAPTLEVNGVNMHRVEGVTPWDDAYMKVEVTSIKKGMKILDICTGLGYTAIISLRKGASEVWTIEKDVNVLRMAEANPWSKGLENQQIRTMLGDAAKAVVEFEDEAFDAIIHDPPTISQATGLYSVDFYRELYRVLKKGGALNHYTGLPGSRTRGMDIVQGVSRRLKMVGFTVKVSKELMSVVAVKE